METATCPRRMYEMGGWERKENLDGWNLRDGLPCCTFCGSLNPDTFMEFAANGAVLGPTDKNYKVYVAVEGHRHCKFYFLHLSDEQQIRFVELCNMRPRPFQIEYPHKFYVLPFFMQYAPEEVNDG